MLVASFCFRMLCIRTWRTFHQNRKGSLCFGPKASTGHLSMSWCCSCRGHAARPTSKWKEDGVWLKNRSRSAWVQTWRPLRYEKLGRVAHPGEFPPVEAAPCKGVADVSLRSSQRAINNCRRCVLAVFVAEGSITNTWAQVGGYHFPLMYFYFSVSSLGAFYHLKKIREKQLRERRHLRASWSQRT